MSIMACHNDACFKLARARAAVNPTGWVAGLTLWFVSGRQRLFVAAMTTLLQAVCRPHCVLGLVCADRTGNAFWVVRRGTRSRGEVRVPRWDASELVERQVIDSK
jgi:hypothetical protein